MSPKLMFSKMFMGSVIPISEARIAFRLTKEILFGTTKKGLSKDVGSTKIPAGSPSGLVNPLGTGSLNPLGAGPLHPLGTGLVNALGEPLDTSTVDLGSGAKQNRGNGSSGVSSVKSRCEINDLRVGKSNTGEDWAYILAGIDKERQEKYGEVIYEPNVYPPEVIRMESEGQPKWGFLLVEKLPRWRKIVRGIAGFVTLVGGTYLLTPFVGPIPAAIISAAATIGVRKLLTLGRSVHFSAETADRHLTNGYTPKRDYDIFERLVREAAHKVVLNDDTSVRFQN